MKIPIQWRDIPQHYRLEATQCIKCGNITFPPKPACPSCKSTDLEKIKLPTKGKVLTYTVIHTAPQKFTLYTPYIVAIIELENGAKITAQITDCTPEEISIGTPVEAVFRRISAYGEKGTIVYGYKFRPIRVKSEQ
ncbi:MAG: Zn-ribbon domain-containing OB-fold protein [Candidatus Odinarchaeia archaeon]